MVADCPLISGNLSAFSRLTELTVICPHPSETLVTETGVPLDEVEITRHSILELVNACKALPSFNTLQIVHFLANNPNLPIRGWWPTEDGTSPSLEQLRKALMDRVKDVKDVAIECLKKPEIGCQEGEGKKKTTLRVIKLGTCRPSGEPYLDCARVRKVEECEV